MRRLKLIRDGETAAAGEIGKLDEDPLCDRQDDDGFRPSSVMVARQSAEWVAAVRFAVGVVPAAISPDLATVGDGWRITDAHSRSTRSLVSFLDGVEALP